MYTLKSTICLPQNVVHVDDYKTDVQGAKRQSSKSSFDCGLKVLGLVYHTAPKDFSDT